MMQCRKCRHPVVDMGNGTYHCGVCQRIISTLDVISRDENEDPDMPDLIVPTDGANAGTAAENPSVNAQNAPAPTFKTCGMCSSLLDDAGDGSYFCPVCGVCVDPSLITESQKPKRLRNTISLNNTAPVRDSSTDSSTNNNANNSAGNNKSFAVILISAVIVLIFSFIATQFEGGNMFIFFLLASMWKIFRSKFPSLVDPTNKRAKVILIALVCITITIIVIATTAVNAVVYIDGLQFSYSDWDEVEEVLE